MKSVVLLAVSCLAVLPGFVAPAAVWIGSAKGTESSLGASRARCVFKVKQVPVRQATVRVASPCFCEVWMDGERVDPLRMLSPAATDYAIHAHEDEYDVTARLSTGKHCIGFWIAPGYAWDYSMHGWRWLQPKCVRAEVKVVYADGTVDYLGTGGKWWYRESSPVTSASIYHGEVFDGRLEDPTWCRVDGAGEGWMAAKPAVAAPPAIERSRIPPIRRTDPLRPIGVRKIGEGRYVVDFGVNRAGVVELRAMGPRGQVVRIRTAEERNSDWRLDHQTNRGAKNTDVWTLAGTGQVETYCPRFTYHGFRFAEISGYPGELTASDVTGWAVKSTMRRTATFDCSDPEMVKLFEITCRTLESNLLAFPTDCCQRDERTPCLGDVQAHMRTTCRLFDARDFLATFIGNISPERTVNPLRPGGLEPGEVPVKRCNADWNGCAITLPWVTWMEYGDRARLIAAYPAMRRTMAWFLEEYPDFICWRGYGDWNPPNDGRWQSFFGYPVFVNSAMLVRQLEIMMQAAKTLGLEADSRYYAERFQAAKAAFNAKFLKADQGVYDQGEQIAYIQALAYDLVPADLRTKVERKFLTALRQRDGGKLDFGGYQGTALFGGVMCDLGEADLALDVLMRSEQPGFGYMLRQGATALWEQWAERGDMHAHNHVVYAGAVNFFFSHLAGIRQTAPGYSEVEIAPVFPKRLDYLTASQDTVRGSIAVSWKRTADKIDLEISLPEGVGGQWRGISLHPGRNEFRIK